MSNKMLFTYNGKDKVPKDATSITFSSSVTEISDYAFKDCHSLTSIIIPDAISQIGNYAFYDCINLEFVSLPLSLRDIGNAAFDGCSSLTCVVIPPLVSKIRYRAFYRCVSLNSVFLPLGSVRDVRNNAFSDCHSLTLVCIPSSVRNVLYSAFDNTDTLKLATAATATANVGDAESWLQVRFDHLPLHQLCYYFYYHQFDYYKNMTRLNSNTNLRQHQDPHESNGNEEQTSASKSKSTPSSESNNNMNTEGEPPTSSMSNIKHQILNMIHENPSTIQTKDKLGLTPFHILSSYPCTCSKSTPTSINFETNHHSDENNDKTHYNNMNHTDYDDVIMLSSTVFNRKIYIDIYEVMNKMIELCPEVTTIKTGRHDNDNDDDTNNTTSGDNVVMERMTPLATHLKCCHICKTIINGKGKPSCMTSTILSSLSSRNNNDNAVSYFQLPISLSIKLGMKWNYIRHIINMNPNVPLERGLTKLMKNNNNNHDVVINDDDNGNYRYLHQCQYEYDESSDCDLYPFMQAAVQGDLESAYHLAFYRIDLFQ